MSAQTAEVTFDQSRDDYGRSVHWVRPETYPSEPLIGSITKLPKRTFPVTTYMVNDFRVTRQPGKSSEVVLVRTLEEAKAMFR